MRYKVRSVLLIIILCLSFFFLLPSKVLCAGQWFGCTGAGAGSIAGAPKILINQDGQFPCPIDGQVTKIKTDFASGGTGTQFYFVICEWVSDDTYHVKAKSEILDFFAGSKEYTLDTALDISTGDVIGIIQIDGYIKCLAWQGSGYNVQYAVGNKTVCTNFLSSTKAQDAMGLQAYVEEEVQEYERSASQSISVSLSGDRLIEVTRQVTQTIIFGLTGFGSKAMEYNRAANITLTFVHGVMGLFFDDYATKGFVLAAIFLLMFIGAPITALIWRKR